MSKHTFLSYKILIRLKSLMNVNGNETLNTANKNLLSAEKSRNEDRIF